jgi:hypothetical protein
MYWCCNEKGDQLLHDNALCEYDPQSAIW